MLWGLLGAMLILSIYAFDARDGTTLDRVAVPTLLLLVVVAGIALTNSLWKSRALGSNAGFRPWLVWLQGLGITVAAFILVVFVGDFLWTALDVNTNFSVYFTLVAGVVMLYVAVRHQRAPWCRFSWSFVAAALLLLNGGLMMGLLDSGPEPHTAASLWATLAIGGSLFLAGSLHARLG
jgi:hypothetical protein